MPLSDDFIQEIETAATEALKSDEVEKDDKAAAETTDDVGTETVTSENGDTGAAAADGGDSTTTEEGGAGGGGGESTETDATAKPGNTETRPTISDAALTEAVRHGIPLEDARLFPNESALGRAIQAVRSSIEKLAPKEEKKEVVEEEDQLAKLLESNKDEYDDAVKAVLEAVIADRKKQQERVKELEARYEKYNENSEYVRQQAVQKEVGAWFDSQVVALGDDFKEVLGVGSTDALLPNSPQSAKRAAIADQAAVMFAGYTAMGKADINRDEVFKAAAKIVLADEYAKISEKKLTANLQKRSKQHIQRAGGKTGGKADDSSADEAIKLLRDKFGIK
ncbi:MAG: hypothetical protein WC455_27305 [Dehalococcoidia bacterium]